MGDAVHNAVRFMKEGGVDAIKLEGGVAVADKIEAIGKAGIVVFGHIGLTPQSSAAMGGFKVQGKNTATAKAVIDELSPFTRREPEPFCSKAFPKRSARSYTRSFPFPSTASAPASSATVR